MVHLFRNYQRPLMIVITVLIIIAFGFLYNGTQLDRIGADQVYQIYGQPLKQVDVERTARRFSLAQALGMNEMILGLAGNAYTQEQAMENFVWNSYVLTHESARLGIVPTDQEVANRMRELPNLQTNGQFDLIKYQEFVQNVLMPNGFTSLQLEDLVRDELRLKRLTELLASTVDVTPQEFRSLYTRSYQKTDVSLVHFNLADFTAGVEPTEEQIKSYFEANTASLKTDERRVVSIAEIVISEEEKQLTGRDRMAALSRQSERAENFGQELLKEGASFATAAEKMGLKVTASEEFTLSAPAEALTKVKNGAAAAFALTEEARESNPLEIEEGLAVLHLEKIIPARPLTLEEARPRIVEALKSEQGRNDMTAKANETRTKLESALGEGKSLADAAQAAGVSVASFPAFSAAEPVQQPGAYQIAEACTELPVGGLSRVVPTQEGAVLVYVNKREPIDEAKMLAEEARQMPLLRQSKGQAVFSDWLSSQLRIANPHSIRRTPTQDSSAEDAEGNS